MRHRLTPSIGRRPVLLGAAASLTAQLIPGRAAFGQSQLAPTPEQSAGPFYPVKWDGDIDSDLVIVTGEDTKSLGQVVHLEGRILDVQGQPISDAKVEIWQCDANGVYRHPRDVSASRQRDVGFQGRGRTVTDSSGKYTFRTIKPVPYPGRTPHIHFAVYPPAGQVLVTQMYVFGEPLNDRDFLFNALRDHRQRDSVLVRLETGDRFETGALAGTFDIVVG